MYLTAKFAKVYAMNAKLFLAHFTKKLGVLCGKIMLKVKQPKTNNKRVIMILAFWRNLKSRI